MSSWWNWERVAFAVALVAVAAVGWHAQEWHHASRQEPLEERVILLEKQVATWRALQIGQASLDAANMLEWRIERMEALLGLEVRDGR